MEAGSGNLALLHCSCSHACLTAYSNILRRYLNTTCITINRGVWRLGSATNRVSRCQSPLRYLPSSPIRRTLRRWDVEQSPFTVVEVDLCWRRPPLLTKPQGLLHSFSLTGTIFLSIRSHIARIQSSRSLYFTSSNHLSCGFYSNFYWRLASKSLHIH